MCLIPTGITRQCEYNFGGLSKVYLGNKKHFIVSKNSDNVITGFTMNGGSFYEFEAEPETSQLLESLQAGNASKFILQTVNFTLTNITQEKKEVLEALGLALVGAIVVYQNGIIKLAGEYGAGLKSVTGDLDSGTAFGDLNGATISLQGGSLGYANEVTPQALQQAIS
mgnify:CR=1 FL=1